MVTSINTQWNRAVMVAADVNATSSEAAVVVWGAAVVVTLVGALVGACVVVVVIAGGVPEQQPHCVKSIASKLQGPMLFVPVKLAKSE